MGSRKSDGYGLVASSQFISQNRHLSRILLYLMARFSMNITKIGNGGTHQYCPLRMPYARSDRLTKGIDHLQKRPYRLSCSTHSIQSLA